MNTLTLLDRISQRDPDAFVLFMQKYGPGLYTRLLERLGDRKLADEAFRETMLDFYRKLTEHPGEDAVAALLADLGDEVSQRTLLRFLDGLILDTAQEAAARVPELEAPEEPASAEMPEPDVLPREEDSGEDFRPGQGWWFAVVLLILCAMLVSWVIIGLLVSNGTLPDLDLGYRWFDANIAQWFEIE